MVRSVTGMRLNRLKITWSRGQILIRQRTAQPHLDGGAVEHLVEREEDWGSATPPLGSGRTTLLLCRAPSSPSAAPSCRPRISRIRAFGRTFFGAPRRIGLVGEREEDGFDDDGGGQDSQAELPKNL
jgi:hypothetical protein